MFQRLESFLPNLQNASPEVAALKPTALQMVNVRQQMKILIDLKSITLKLQNNSLTFAESDILFQSMI